MNNFKKFIYIVPLITILTGCGSAFDALPRQGNNEPLPKYGLISEDDFLKVTGKKVHTVGDESKNVMLEGINVGGLFFIEQWMSPVTPNERVGQWDQKKFTETIFNRFGEEKSLKYWETYRNYYWTEDDYIQCKKMGMSVLRLPFNYMTVDPEFHMVRKIEGQKYNFELLDKFIDGAGRHGLYVILDLHGAYGSHNGQDHSGEIIADAKDVDFYSNEEKMQKTIDLWDAISKRYINNPIVAAYDLLNEPGEKAGSTTTRHFKFMDRCYDAIRANNDNHIIMFESCWGVGNLPNPTTYEWTNCIYQLHHYSWTNDLASHKTFVDNKMNEINSSTHNVPYYIGEFFCQKNALSWDYTLKSYKENNLHFTPWTYKVVGDASTSGGTSIYVTTGGKFDPDTATYEEMLNNFYTLQTFHKKNRPSTLEGGTMIGYLLAHYMGGEF